MTFQDEITRHEQYLFDLSNSDDDVESLLSSGADVDDLIEAGVLDDGSDETWGWQDVDDDEDPPPPTPGEVDIQFSEWLIANGFSPDGQPNGGNSDASSQPN